MANYRSTGEQKIMKKLLVVCGPTATGKTQLGIDLAKKFSAQGGGEIISADSRQVYKNMDIGTGKDLPAFDGVQVWMLDIVKPDQEFSVAHYIELAWKVIEDIWQRNKLPIIVGGTGFYIKGLVDGIETLGVEPNLELRKELSNYLVVQLSDRLKNLDPARWEKMNESDRNNPRRLIRAIEIASERKTDDRKLKMEPREIDTLFVGLTAPLAMLYQRIDQRVEERMKMGMEKEIKNLLGQGYSFEDSVLGTTIAYQEWRSYFDSPKVTKKQTLVYFESKADKEEVIRKWKFAEHAYARRQLTWFKKDKRVNWFDITAQEWNNKVERLVSAWLTEEKNAEKS